MAQKADSSEVKEILRALENKADYNSFDQLSSTLDRKLDKEEFYLKVFPELPKSTETDIKFEKLSYLIDSNFHNLKTDIEENKRHISANLNSKADLKEIDQILSSLSHKADHTFMLETLDNIKKDSKDLVNEMKREITYDRKRSDDSLEIVNKLKDDIARLKDDVIGVVELTRSDVDEQSKFVKGLVANNRAELKKEISEISDQIDGIKADLLEVADSSVDKSEMEYMKQGITTLYETKASIGEVSTEITNVQRDLLQRSQELKENINTKLNRLETEFFRNVEDKASLLEVQGLLATKIDLSQASKMLITKANIDEFYAVTSELNIIKEEIHKKSNFEELESQFRPLKYSLDSLEKEMLLKANIKDVCTLLDMKANISDTNRALSEIHKELDTKVNFEDYSSHSNSQQSIIEALCAENCTGRWIWKTGELRGGNLIPWETQITNSAPDNFLWEKDKSSIVTVAPGLYEIYFGFYSRKKPAVQILVNGEPIIIATKPLSQVCQSSKSGKTGSHPAGNIIGLTLVEYIALPSRARISMSYTCESQGEGFFCLRKL